MSVSVSSDESVMAALNWPWQEEFAIADTKVQKAPPIPKNHDETAILSCLGLVGLTVLLAFDNMDCAGERNVCAISASAGACGTLAGQVSTYQRQSPLAN